MSNVTRRSQVLGRVLVRLLVLYLAGNRVVLDSMQSSSGGDGRGCPCSCARCDPRGTFGLAPPESWFVPLPPPSNVTTTDPGATPRGPYSALGTTAGRIPGSPARPSGPGRSGQGFVRLMAWAGPLAREGSTSMGRWMPHRRCTEVTGFQWRSSTTACGCTTGSR